MEDENGVPVEDDEEIQVLTEQIHLLQAENGRLREDLIKRSKKRLALEYKIGMGLVVLGLCVLTGAIVLLSGSPTETYRDVICDVSCATYVAERTNTVWQFYPTLWAGIVLVVGGVGTCIVKGMSDSI